MTNARLNSGGIIMNKNVLLLLLDNFEDDILGVSIDC